MKQHIFQFEERHDYMPENFLVSGSNKTAFDAASGFALSSNYALNIYGPDSSGKTYLAHIAAKRGEMEVIEDINPADEKELLHLLNSTKEKDGKIFITSKLPLAEIGFKLPDLTSRLATINSVGIDAPDDGLMYMLFARHFAARQIKVSDEVINYLAARTPRSFEAVAESARKIDALSLSEKKNISIPLIKKVI